MSTFQNQDTKLQFFELLSNQLQALNLANMPNTSFMVIKVETLRQKIVSQRTQLEIQVNGI